MTSFPTDFKTLVKMIGTSPKSEVAEFASFIKQLQIPEMSAEKDDEGDVDVYWEYFADGVEMIWTNKVLVQICIHTRADESFAAYKHQLFEELPNTASAAEVARVFGEPERTGQAIFRPFWRYELGDKAVYFEFGDDERVEFITVGYPVGE